MPLFSIPFLLMLLVPTDRVVFTGNHAISDGELRAELAMDELDVERISALYYDRGYVDATVSKVELEFKIEEGNQYRVGRIVVPAAAQTLALKTTQGQIFNRRQIQEDMALLGKELGIQVVPVTEIELERRIVHLTFELSGIE